MNSFSDEPTDEGFPFISVTSHIDEVDEEEEIHDAETLRHPWVTRRKQTRPHRSLKQLTDVVEKIINGYLIIEPTFDWERKGGLALAISATTAGSTNGRGSRKRRFYAEDDARSDSSRGSSSVNGPGGYARPTITRSPAPMGIPMEEDTLEPGLSRRRQLYEQVLRDRRRGNNRAGMPLDITAAPGASLLDDGEFEVCSTLRLYPIQYFQSRDILVGNYHKLGFFKKSAAQKMLHIDVNKTGKLYDYFVSRGWMPYGPGDLISAMPAQVDWSPIKPSQF